MAYTGYVNKAVRAMYGIPLSQLTPKQRKILKEDGERRRKLIAERQRDFMYNNKVAFDDEAKFEKVLAIAYQDAQKKILADVMETRAKVEKAGGEWSYANQSALTRSRGLFEQINTELVKLGKTEETYFRNYLTEIYTDQFYRTIFTLGQTQTLRGSLNMLNPRLVEATLNYPWSGAMFSDRLWLDKERLGKNLRWGLTQSMILGEGIPEMTKRINNGIETSKYNAERVARTETKRVTYSSQSQAFAEQGIKEVRYMAANNGGDARTCDLCRGDHNTVYKLGEEPTLPRHPNCRCWYVPVVSDTFEDNELNELTGSVRGAENYEKWRQAQEAQAAKEEAKRNTPEALIRADVEKQKKAGEDHRKAIQAQIDVKQEEHRNLPSQYATQLHEHEAESIRQRRLMAETEKKIQALELEKDSLSDKRVSIWEKFDKGLVSEAELDRVNTELRDRRKAIRAEISGLDEIRAKQLVAAEAAETKIEQIQREIRDKQNTLLSQVMKLEDEIRLSIASERDLDLDIKFVGESMERYEHITDFRIMRKALRDNPNFDFDTYKEELIETSKRMDADALTVQRKMAEFVSKNGYNEVGTGYYSPWDKRVHMDMKNNAHEKALGNGLKGSWQTKYHEEGHQLDHLLATVEEITGGSDSGLERAFTAGYTGTGKLIRQALEDDLTAFLQEAIKYSNENEGQAYKPFKSWGRLASDTKYAYARYTRHLTASGADRRTKCQLGMLSDAMGLFSEGRISAHKNGLWGHDESYNKDRGKNGAASETWATFCAIRVAGTPEEKAFARSKMPKTWDLLDSIYHSIAVYLGDHDLSY